MNPSSEPSVVPAANRYWLALFVLGLGLLIVFSLLPRDYAVAVPNLSDKGHHIAAYLCVAYAGIAAFSRDRTGLLVAVSLVFVGIVLELAQSYVPGRFTEFADVMANTGGVLLACAIRCGWRALRSQ